MDENWLALAGVLALAAFVVYRRLRRLLLRQRYSAIRVLIPVVVFGLLTLVLYPVLTLSSGLAPTVGIVLGVGLGLIGYRLTTFDSSDGRMHFSPDRYVGSIVLTLFLGRLIYRILVIGNPADVAVTQADFGMSVPAEFAGSPLTAALLFVLCGYYFSYYAAIWNKGRGLAGESSLASGGAGKGGAR